MHNTLDIKKNCSSFSEHHTRLEKIKINFIYKAFRLLWFPLAFLTLALAGCKKGGGESADLILLNGNVYTADPEQPQASAIAIQGDRIIRIGSNDDVQEFKGASTQLIDLGGKFVMPGFIEGHGHFSGLGSSLMNLNFLKSKSWDEIVATVGEAAKKAKPGEWIIGRGWHQEKWTTTPGRNVLGYPYHDELSAVSPNNPVLLDHASGHSVFANAKAMELAGITVETPNPSGGEIVRDSRGQAVGVFEETAEQLITAAYNDYLSTLSEEQKKEQWLQGIRLAQQECLAKGVTSFQDAGSGFEEVDWYRELAEAGKLDLRLWVMIRRPSDELKSRLDDRFPIIGAGNNFFTCRAIKSALDGALGSYGAWLLSSYEDKTNFTGQNTVPVEEVRKIADLAWQHNMQLCVHAIGDRANRETLDLFEQTFKKASGPKDVRWRIEHAQHLDPADIPRFAGLGVIAAMQGIHCTSDAPFVVKRLGEKRAREGAYPWRSLLDAGAVVTNGTDVPVEDVNPVESFYATVTRKRADTGLAFFPEQRMTREEAIRSYTLSNAYAAFEEDLKGSLSEGKLADIVVLSNDLVTCKEEDILKTAVLMTIVGGQVKFKKQ